MLSDFCNVEFYTGWDIACEVLGAIATLIPQNESIADYAGFLRSFPPHRYPSYAQQGFRVCLETAVMCNDVPLRSVESFRLIEATV